MLAAHRRTCFAAALILIASALPGATSAAVGAPRLPARRGECLLPAWLLGGLCTPTPAPRSNPPTAVDSAVALQRMIDDVPDPGTGRASFHTTDNLGEQLGALDPIADPAGGYLGVYHSPYRSRSGRSFRIGLARSTDLLHWTRIRVLDPAGASMPTVRRIAGTGGYLLAYEKQLARAGNVIRVAYYRSRADLLAAHASERRNLPRRFSPYNDGTPTIVSINWRGSASRSLITLGFHYQSETGHGPGADREAAGLLVGFNHWTARKDVQTDEALSARGLHGNHGDWRQFGFDGFRWRVYEGQTRFNNFGTWHLLLYSASSRAMYPLTLRAGTSRITSLGNPIVREEPAPDGPGNVLVVTTFVFAASAPSLTGELVYYQPL